jgi:pilus assembly protein CpaF
VFCKQLENKQRRVMEVMECEILPDAGRNFRPLFRYDITENRLENGKFIVNGQHGVVQGISQSLQKRFLENGMPQDTLKNILGMGGGAA